MTDHWDPTASGAGATARSVLSERAALVGEGLSGWPRRRVYLRDLWRLLDQADPASRTSASRRSLLSGVLAELAEAELVAFPASASWDRTEQPPLPRFVTLPADEPPPTAARDVWHPTLAWAAEATLTASQRGILATVNRWLHQHRGEVVAPVRERSLDIFGNEKALDRLQRTALFGPGRLSLEMLHARRAVPRLTTERVGPGATLLVVENSDTFDTMVRVLANQPGGVGLVGWGAGGGFEASVLSIAALTGRVRQVCYFGDLDRRGLEIPANASRLAVAEGLPAVHPAAGLYRLLIETGTPHPGQPALSAGQAEAVTQWLPPDLRTPTAGLLRSGVRLAQEAVGVEFLSTREFRL